MEIINILIITELRETDIVFMGNSIVAIVTCI